MFAVVLGSLDNIGIICSDYAFYAFELSNDWCYDIPFSYSRLVLLFSRSLLCLDSVFFEVCIEDDMGYLATLASIIYIWNLIQVCCGNYSTNLTPFFTLLQGNLCLSRSLAEYLDQFYITVTLVLFMVFG